MPGQSATISKSSAGKIGHRADSTTKTTTTRSIPTSKHAASEAALEEKAARTQVPTSVEPVEPEDAYLTGVSRSLQRRLLGLNVGGAGSQAKPLPGASVAGLHPTGSYTATQGVKPESSPKPAKGDKK
jgi:hypothetical protein